MRDEPQPPIEIPAPPKHVTDEALEEWNRIAAELCQLGLLSALDRAALAAYCVAWGRWVRAEQAVAELGELIRSNAGEAVANPHLAIADRALKQMHQFLTEFGMTPSSRTRVAAAKPAAASGVQKRKRG